MFIMFIFAYMSNHVVEEKRQKKYLPLAWEEGGFLNNAYHKIFDKSEVKYTDGDNT
jgi:hypothetical protein